MRTRSTIWIVAIILTVAGGMCAIASASDTELRANGDKTLTIVTARQLGVEFVVPYAPDWQFGASEAAPLYGQSETTHLVASVSIDDWGERITEVEYLNGNLKALQDKFPVKDPLITSGMHAAFSYFLSLPGKYQLNVWSVRQDADNRVYRLHISTVLMNPDMLKSQRLQLTGLVSTGFALTPRR